MTLRQTIGRPLLKAVAQLPEPIQRAMWAPQVRRICIRLPLVRAVYTVCRDYSGCLRRHPFDAQYGIDTSGLVFPFELQANSQHVDQLNGYMGSQPSIIRRALDALGPIDGYTFVDIGCGKGRPMIVASEYPFDAVLGYDINTDLVATANANAAAIGQRFPDRPPIRATTADVADLVLPNGKVVIFLFNPFGPELISALIRKLEKALSDRTITHLFAVYYHPVSGDIFDGAAALRRWYAATLPYDEHEIGFGPLESEGVVIWQSIRGARPDTCVHRNLPIASKDRLNAVVG